MPNQNPFGALMRRSTTVRTTGIVGAGALVLGLAVGAIGGQTDPTESQAYVSLQSNLTAMNDDRDELEREAEALADENAELSSENRGMQDAQADLARDQQKLADSVEKLKTRLATVEEREEAVAAAEAKLAAAPAQPQAAPALPTTTSYDNCTAVRAAGAAPITSGDPGYGRHLDRDGDGVGCE
jgi:septal ring factor EnvC (AmiA/AmiB activator)